jgi:hypothetical protein
VTVDGEGNTSTISYSAWDSDGRPTAGTRTSAGSSLTISESYNDAARTITIVQSGAGLPTATATSTYDENGNGTKSVTSWAGGAYISTIAITGTERVCK